MGYFYETSEFSGILRLTGVPPRFIVGSAIHRSDQKLGAITPRASRAAVLYLAYLFVGLENRRRITDLHGILDRYRLIGTGI